MNAENFPLTLKRFKPLSVFFNRYFINVNDYFVLLMIDQSIEKPMTV